MPSLRAYNGGVPFNSLLPTDAFLVDRIGVGTGFIEADQLPEEEPILPAAGPVIYGTKEWQRVLSAATAWAQDLTPMVGYAAVAGTTGGNGKTLVICTNASNDPSVPGSIAAAAAFSIANNGALILLYWHGQFVVNITETLPFGPNTTVAAPGYNWKIVTADSTIDMVTFSGANWIMKGVAVLRSVQSNGGDGFSYGSSGFSAAGVSPVPMTPATDGVTLNFSATALVPPIRPYLTTIMANGVVVATDITTGTYNSDGITGTINFGTGALSTTFATAPAAAVAIQAQFITTDTLGTGNGATVTFTGTLNTSAIPSTLTVVLAGVTIAGDNGSGVISGQGVTGTINYGTGAVSVTFTTPPVAGATVVIQYTVLQQYGTGNASTTTFTTTLTGPFVNGVCTIYLSGVSAAGVLQPATGTIAGTNITGTVNYGTGAIAISYGSGHAPANTVVLTAGFASSGQKAGDNLHLVPTLNDMGWVYQCTFQFAGDGLLDIGASALVPSSPACQITIQNNLFRWHDKGCALGSDSGWIPIGTALVLLTTWTGNVFDGVASRSPRVGPLTFVDSYANLHILAPHIRPDGSHGEIIGLEVGSSAGVALCEANLFIPAYDQIAYPGGIAATYNFVPSAPGALKVVNCVAVGGLPLVPGNESYVPVPPYARNVPTIPPQNTPAFGAYIASLFANAGAQRAGEFEMQYIGIPNADAVGPNYLVDGYNVDAQFDANGNWIGIYFATGDVIEAPNPANGTTVAIAVQNVTMAAGVATLTIPDNLYGLVPHTGTTDTLTNVVTDGTWSFANGQVITLQLASSSYTITLSAAGAGTPGAIRLPTGTYTMKGLCGNLVLVYGSGLNSGLGGFNVTAFPLQI